MLITDPKANIPYAEIKEAIDDKIYSSNNCGDFIILEKNNATDITIQFLYNGYIRKTRSDEIRSGMITNPYFLRYYNVACLGLADKSNPHYKKARDTWKHMISRCYSAKNKSYKYYGGKGVHVSRRWLVFEYFLEDIQKLEGWENKKANWSKYTLDKDKSKKDLTNRLYSLRTCCWLSRKEQTTYSSSQILFDAIAPDGTVHKDMTNLTVFCNEIGIGRRDAGNRLNGKHKYKVGGWDFVNRRMKYPKASTH